MREFKFRGKRFSDNSWIYGSLVASREISPAIYFSIGKGSVKQMEWVYVKSETIGQFTGLTDCKGKEIYEGDILDFTIFDVFGDDRQYRGVVRYCGSCFMIWQSLDGDDAFDLDWIIEQDDECEIIGNIYDNPELTRK